MLTPPPSEPGGAAGAFDAKAVSVAGRAGAGAARLPRQRSGAQVLLEERDGPDPRQVSSFFVVARSARVVVEGPDSMRRPAVRAAHRIRAAERTEV